MNLLHSVYLQLLFLREICKLKKSDKQILFHNRSSKAMVYFFQIHNKYMSDRLYLFLVLYLLPYFLNYTILFIYFNSLKINIIIVNYRYITIFYLVMRFCYSTIFSIFSKFLYLDKVELLFFIFINIFILNLDFKNFSFLN